MADLPVFTYQTRVHLQPQQDAALEASVSASFRDHGQAVQRHTNWTGRQSLIDQRTTDSIDL